MSSTTAIRPFIRLLDALAQDLNIDSIRAPRCASSATAAANLSAEIAVAKEFEVACRELNQGVLRIKYMIRTSANAAAIRLTRAILKRVIDGGFDRRLCSWYALNLRIFHGDAACPAHGQTGFGMVNWWFDDEERTVSTSLFATLGLLATPVKERGVCVAGGDAWTGYLGRCVERGEVLFRGMELK